MRRDILRLLLLSSITISLFSGCDFVKKKLGMATSKPAASGTAGKTTAAPARLCPNGSPAQVLSGACGGTWRFKGNVCEFEWGPTVKCPSGTKALALEAACYGVTAKPIQSGAVTSAESCATQFGKHPISPNYILECCGT